MQEVGKTVKKRTVKKVVELLNFTPSLRQLAHLHVQLYQTLKSRRAFAMVSCFVCYDFAAKH